MAEYILRCQLFAVLMFDISVDLLKSAKFNIYQMLGIPNLLKMYLQITITLKWNAWYTQSHQIYGIVPNIQRKWSSIQNLDKLNEISEIL